MSMDYTGIESHEDPLNKYLFSGFKNLCPPSATIFQREEEHRHVEVHSRRHRARDARKPDSTAKCSAKIPVRGRSRGFREVNPADDAHAPPRPLPRFFHDDLPNTTHLMIIDKKHAIAATAGLLALSATLSAGEWKQSLGVEGFFGAAAKDISDDIVENEKINIGGVNLRGTVSPTDAFAGSTTLSPEFFGLLGFGAGSLDATRDYYGYYGYFEHEKLEYDLALMQLAVGSNIRWAIAEQFSLSAGVRIGIAVSSADMEYTYNDSDGYYGNADEDDTAVGFLYGIGIGAEYAFNEHHALTLAYDFVGSTARNEFSVEGEKFKSDAQSYHTFSVGYKYTF